MLASYKHPIPEKALVLFEIILKYMIKKNQTIINLGLLQKLWLYIIL